MLAGLTSFTLRLKKTTDVVDGHLVGDPFIGDIAAQHSHLIAKLKDYIGLCGVITTNGQTDYTHKRYNGSHADLTLTSFTLGLKETTNAVDGLVTIAHHYCQFVSRSNKSTPCSHIFSSVMRTHRSRRSLTFTATTRSI